MSIQLFTLTDTQEGINDLNYSFDIVVTGKQITM